ncbi:MAG TPA: hypothetical protein VFX02_03970 [Gammaproteobacteria bacterium]|nr:hypothetical protein [Gammaproteobacteria bacterium]
MFRRLACGGLLALALVSAGAHAGTMQSNLVISKVTPEGSGILVTFTTQPVDCATNYKGAHAYLGTSIKGFDMLYLVVTTAQVTGTPVTIYYADNGDCSGVAQLLSLSDIVAN